MSKQEQLQAVLGALADAVPDVEGSLLASRDGLPIVATMASADASRVAAMAATVLSLATRVVETTALGTFEETVIQSDEGTFVVYDAGELAALAVVARGGANLGLIHLEARRAAEELAHMLASFREEAASRARPVHAAPTPAPSAAAPSAAAPTAINLGASVPAPPTTPTTPPAALAGATGPTAH